MLHSLKRFNPNYMTGLGLTLVPFIIITQQMAGIIGLSLCLLFLSLRETTDILDGWLARFTNQVSNFGKLFDPLVDSLARTSVFIAFLASGWMPLWMVLLIFARDITVGYIRAFSASHGIVIAARPSGKYIKAIPQAVAQIGTVLGYLLVECGIGLPVEIISWWLLFLATACTFSTLFDYLYAAATQIKAKNLIS